MLMTEGFLRDDLSQIVRQMPKDSSSTFLAEGTLALIFKLNDSTLRKINGEFVLRFENQLGLYPTGAVLIVEMVFFPNTVNMFRFPHLFNINDQKDHAILKALATQKYIPLHFFDNGASYRFSKNFERNIDKSSLVARLEMAKVHNAGLTSIDFSAAKAAMIAQLRNPEAPDNLYDEL